MIYTHLMLATGSEGAADKLSENGVTRPLINVQRDVGWVSNLRSRPASPPPAHQALIEPRRRAERKHANPCAGIPARSVCVSTVRIHSRMIVPPTFRARGPQGHTCISAAGCSDSLGPWLTLRGGHTKANPSRGWSRGQLGFFFGNSIACTRAARTARRLAQPGQDAFAI